VDSVTPGQSILTKFFLDTRNSVTRERLLLHRLSFDLYVAAAKRGYALALFSIEVDREGYDLVLDDGDYEARLQLKSILSSSTTRVWKTVKHLLRPQLLVAEKLGFELSPEGVGLGGGIVLIEFNTESPSLHVTYGYTDVVILSAMARGWVPGQESNRKQAETLLAELRKGSGAAKLEVPIGVFVRPKGPDELLALSGLHSISSTQFRYQIGLRLGRGYNFTEHGPLEDQIRTDLAILLNT
jgi:hypothetical protein